MTTELEAEVIQSHAVAVREQNMAVGRALSVEEIGDRLRFIKQVMEQNMTEGVDYGKIPGCGDKPGLFQPGAQKLLLTFQLRDQLKKEVLREFPNMHREYEITVEVRPVGTNPGDGWDGVGTCSTLESKYRYRSGGRKCPECGKETILRSKNKGEGWFCWAKKGGCGAQFAADDPAIERQNTGKVEHDNAPDNWNTVRKMAFKRALIHAAINATNTSELWSQDLEDLAANAQAEGEEGGFEAAAPTKPTQKPPGAKAPHPSPTPSTKAAGKGKSTSNPLPTEATPDQRTRLIEHYKAEYQGIQKLLAYYIEIAALMPNESLDDLELRWVPCTGNQFKELVQRVGDHNQGDGPAHKCVWMVSDVPHGTNAPKSETKAPESGTKPPNSGTKPIMVPRDANPDPDSPDAPWRSFPVPFGKHAGVALAKLDKGVLFGFWANFTVETEYNGKPKNEKVIERDTKFREMLTESGKHYGFELPEDKQQEREEAQDDLPY